MSNANTLDIMLMVNIEMHVIVDIFAISEKYLRPMRGMYDLWGQINVFVTSSINWHKIHTIYMCILLIKYIISMIIYLIV